MQTHKRAEPVVSGEHLLHKSICFTLVSPNPLLRYGQFLSSFGPLLSPTRTIFRSLDPILEPSAISVHATGNDFG